MRTFCRAKCIKESSSCFVKDGVSGCCKQALKLAYAERLTKRALSWKSAFPPFLAGVSLQEKVVELMNSPGYILMVFALQKGTQNVRMEENLLAKHGGLSVLRLPASQGEQARVSRRTCCLCGLILLDAFTGFLIPLLV